MINVRPATTLDLAAINEIRAEITAEGMFSLEPISSGDLELAENDDQVWYVAEHSGTLSGFAEAHPLGAHPDEVSLTIFVSGSKRGCGLGEALLDSLIAWAQRKPRYVRLVLFVKHENRGARRLYERAGFEFLKDYGHSLKLSLSV